MNTNRVLVVDDPGIFGMHQEIARQLGLELELKNIPAQYASALAETRRNQYSNSRLLLVIFKARHLETEFYCENIV